MLTPSKPTEHACSGSSSTKVVARRTRELRITPTLALRLEAALEIPVREWLVGLAPADLWVLSEHMERELAWIRRRRYRLNELRRHEDGRAP
jgi:plasmid maintenance system antidote protein VapI